MTKILYIANRDFKSYFTGLVAYVAAGLFMMLMSWMFFNVFVYFANNQYQMMAQGNHQSFSLNEYVFAPHFSNVNVILLIMIPALTMRLFAEERKNRTLDLLMTSPLTAGQIVAGKFIAGLGIVWTIIGTLALYPIVTSFFGHFDKGPILTTFLGLGLLTSVYVAIGIFASSLTESAIIAFIVAFVIEMFFWVIGWAGASMESAMGQTVFNYLSIVGHYADFTKGIIDTSGVIYYVSMAFFFCFLSQRVLESARWR